MRGSFSPYYNIRVGAQRYLSVEGSKVTLTSTKSPWSLSLRSSFYTFETKADNIEIFANSSGLHAGDSTTQQAHYEYAFQIIKANENGSELNILAIEVDKYICYNGTDIHLQNNPGSICDFIFEYYFDPYFLLFILFIIMVYVVVPLCGLFIVLFFVCLFCIAFATSLSHCATQNTNDASNTEKDKSSATATAIKTELKSVQQSDVDSIDIYYSGEENDANINEMFFTNNQREEFEQSDRGALL